ncbi:ABC transporter permease [Rhodospirillaceae bacterium SYSU D60014]|uniref:ABC transporter permease n=1 Tax=Virgifigura deserti TaxID=2268457 RepID=UPI000E66FB9B
MTALAPSQSDANAPRLVRGGGRGGRNRPALGRGKGLLLPVLLLVLWEALSRFGVFAPNLLPAPSKVLGAIADLAVTGELLEHIAITLYRVALGFLIGGAAATLLGAATGYSRTARELLDPLLQSLRNIPSIAWVPLFILWLGIYEASKVTLIATGVFFPVYLNLMSGIQNVDRKLVEVGRVYRLSGLQLVRRVLLPATLPTYIVGLRSGLGLGWMFVVAAEYMGASKGLGFLLVDGQMTGRPQIIIGSIALFAIFGKLTDLLLATVGERFLTWQDSFSSNHTRASADAADR